MPLEKGFGYICLMYRQISFFWILAVCMACTRTNPTHSNSGPGMDEPFAPTYTLSELDSSARFTKGSRAVGEVDSVPEVSGMVNSFWNPSCLWVHNDGGDGPYLFLIHQDSAQLKATFQVNTINYDWEDIALNVSPGGDKSFLWIADIGDNLGGRPDYRLIQLAEPLTKPEMGIPMINPIREINFVYPDGNHNAECLLVDPFQGELIIITRDNPARVYSLMPSSGNNLRTLTFRGVLPIPGITGGDVSRNGNHILLRTYHELLLIDRLAGQTVAEALANMPTLLPYTPEPQGEAICWGNGGYYTLSERVGQALPVLYHYAE